MEGNFTKKAQEEYKKGTKDLETGFFKRKPDYVSAVSHFEEAAKLYKTSKNWLDCIKSYEQAIICNNAMDDPWAVARNMQGIINLIIDQDLKEFIDNLIEQAKKAGNYFKASDSYSESLKLYTKVAKYLVKYEKQNIAIDIMLEALNDAEESGKKYNKGDVQAYLLELLVEYGKYERVISVLSKDIENTNEQNKNLFVEEQILVCILMCILLGEEIRADDLLMKFSQKISYAFKSIEYQTAGQLLDAYKEGNQVEFDKLVNKHPIKQLYPVNIVRQIKKVKVKQIIVQEKQQFQAQEQEKQYENLNQNQIQEQEQLNQSDKLATDLSHLL